MGRVVVFFDEGCLLCSGSVRWLHKRDKREKLWFAGLGSEFASVKRDEFGLPEPGEGAETFAVLDEGGKEVFFRSDGIWRVLGEIGGIWGGVGAIYRWVPKMIRDWEYRLVARNRRKWFGTTEICEVPPGSLRGRVLD
ncbi:MAG: DCC1-like thiol-disulfide oxidoreductase family protein [Verrucomicrobiota bacterium]